MSKTDTSILYIGNKLAVHGRTPGNIDTLGPLLEQEGYKVRYSSSKLNKPARIADMWQAIFRNRKKVDVVLIDVFSTSAFYFAWSCARLCRLLGVKYVPILRGGNLPERFKTSAKKCKELFGNSAQNIAVSDYMDEQLRIAGYKSIIIENHIELSLYKFRSRDTLQPSLIWVRAFHETYNPKMAIELLKLLVVDYPTARLTMVGPELDGNMQKCKELTASYGLNDNIVFTGKLSKQEWTQLANEADIFISTTNYDNLPVSVIEAMALGLPVVSTNVGGVPYLIKDGKNGLLVNQGDAEGMKAAIEKLINANGVAHPISINARATAEQYDWDVLRKKWADLFTKIKDN